MQSGSRATKLLKNLAALGVGLLAAFLLAEIVLRIYNPFVVRIKGDRIILPVNQKYVIPNKKFPQLDDTIYHSKNSLGFRGPEKPSDFNAALTIIAVGGSTTECAYLSDGHDWPAILGQLLKTDFPGIWINNAGLDGHSTFGHQVLMNDYLVKLKPDYILFLTGANDMKREDLSRLDSLTLKGRKVSFRGWLVEHSEVLALVHNFLLQQKSSETMIGHSPYNNLSFSDTLTFSPALAQAEKGKHYRYFEPYKNRLRQLIRTARQNGIEPVFCTQPSLWAYTTEPETGTNLGNINFNGIPTGLDWEIRELYNDQLRSVCGETKVYCIDLAARMPKRFRYFYDNTHYTNEGAAKVAEIVAVQMKKFLLSRTAVD